MNGFSEFLTNNIGHVFPILIAAAFAVAIVVERSVALFSRYPVHNQDGFIEKITSLVMANKMAEALALCDRYPAKPSAQVVKQALLRAHQPETLIENGLEITVNKATQAIQRRTQFLSTIANVATLLGLFGTIAGLIHSFQAIGNSDASQKASLLASGISTAMNATMLGLGVAIPCMVAFSFLMNKTNRLVSEIEHAAIHAMDILKQRYYAAETGATHDQDFESDHAEAPKNGHGKVVSMRRAA
jgi:biopolymer transport protein ExbB